MPGGCVVSPNVLNMQVILGQDDADNGNAFWTSGPQFLAKCNIIYILLCKYIILLIDAQPASSHSIVLGCCLYCNLSTLHNSWLPDSDHEAPHSQSEFEPGTGLARITSTGSTVYRPGTH